MIRDLSARCDELSLKVKDSDKNLDLPYLLQMLVETSRTNSSRTGKHGHRFDPDWKLFATQLYIVGGPSIYEFLYANSQNGLPSRSTVERTLSELSPVVEGEFRFDELKEFLISHNLPLKVWLSEDGTRIVEKFQFDTRTNQIVGPVISLSEDGIPLINSFPATSAAAIATHFQQGVPATCGYVIMAQPLLDGAPAFCLALFGTDNRFTSEQVYRRWAVIDEELKKRVIEMVGTSADGDPKLLSAMQSYMFLEGSESPFKEDWKDWFFASDRESFTVMQDMVHTANKFRARLNLSACLPIGNFNVSQSHVRILITNVDKRDHGLTFYDLDKKDKMNFDASVKICSEKVTTLIQERVPGSSATVAYLTAMRFCIESCLKDLFPLERLYKIWYTAFFLRFWRLWLIAHPKYSLDNFVTLNLFTCVEIIAHAMIILVVKFRDQSTVELFLCHLFSSQGSESFFRKARSMTSTFSTITNFSVLEFLHRVKRIDMLHLISSKLADKMVFPQDKRKRLLGSLTGDKLRGSYFPDDMEIEKIVMKARDDASATLQALGAVDILSNTPLKQIKTTLTSCRNFGEATARATDNEAIRSYQADFTEDDIPLDLWLAFPTADSVTNLNPLAENADISEPENSIFVLVPKSSGTGFVRMKKTTFCWMLSLEGTVKLSTDRLQRVRDIARRSFGQLRRGSNENVHPKRKGEIQVGDWCVFKMPEEHLVGQVLSFSYLSGKSRSYTLLKAPTSLPEGSKERGLQCLCDFYKGDMNRGLQCVQSDQRFVNMNNYVAHIPKPVPSEYDSGFDLVPEVYTYLQNLS